MCPSCGFDLAHDQPIILNDFSMISAISPLYFRNKAIKLTHSERTMMWALMKAYPKPVSHDALLNRIDSEAEGPVIDVHASRIRSKLRTLGAPIPFESIRISNIGRRSLCWVIT